MAEQTAEQVAAEAAAVAAKTQSDTALKEMVAGAVRTGIDSIVKEAQTKRAEEETARAAEAEAVKARASTDAMSEIFKPALEPALAASRNAELRATMAADAVDFYTTHAADPTILKYRGKIEEVIVAQLKRGNLISRKDAWNWLRGGELYDDLSKETLTAHEAKVKAAQEASTVGTSVTMPTFSKPFDELETDELGKALRGVSF